MIYNYLKLLHVISVILFLGNIITGLFWMHIAVKTKDERIISHTIKGIIRSDRIFTIPGVVLITTFGLIAAIHGHLPLLHTGWILWSIILFTVSGIAFTVKVSPLQKKMLQLTSDHETPAGFDWTNFNKTHLEWEIWGLISLLAPCTAMAMMILKMPK